MWFTETPWPPIVICSVVAAIFFGLWQTGGRTMYFNIGVGLLLIAVAFFFVEKGIVTDGEKVEAAVHGLADAVEQDDLEAALAHISQNADLERGLVKTGLDLIDVEGTLRVSDLQVELFSENSRARSHFRANGTIRYAGEPHYTPTRWMLTWQREGGDWKVTRIERLSPTGGQGIDPMAKRVE